MRVTYRRQALADIDDISRYLEQLTPIGAHTVVQAIYHSIRMIADHPHGFGRTNDPDIRVKTLGRYRYKIFYKILAADTIRIIHVRHTSRRPWK